MAPVEDNKSLDLFHVARSMAKKRAAHKSREAKAGWRTVLRETD